MDKIILRVQGNLPWIFQTNQGMKAIVITGVAGLLGSRLANWILENEPTYQVLGIDNLSGGYKDHIDSRVLFHQLDLAKDNLDPIFSAHNVEFVFHFAAYAAEGLSPFIRKYNYTNNVVATANVVNACIAHGVGRLVFTSSMAVYGAGNPPFDEHDIPNPIDPYGIAKYACEMDIQVAGQQHGLDWCIIRPHNVYGINQNIWDRYRNVLGIWIYQKLNNQSITIFGDGSQKRAFSCIDDCLLPLWNAAVAKEASKEIINIGSSKEYQIIEAAKLLQDIVGGAEIKFLEKRHEVHAAFATHQKSIDLLGYQDNTNLNAGLVSMWHWAKSQPKRQQFVWPAYELENGLYQFWK
jgi:UDP-glucose 4-epimerase